VWLVASAPFGLSIKDKSGIIKTDSAIGYLRTARDELHMGVSANCNSNKWFGAMSVFCDYSDRTLYAGGHFIIGNSIGKIITPGGSAFNGEVGRNESYGFTENIRIDRPVPEETLSVKLSDAQLYEKSPSGKSTKQRAGFGI
jgi:hypothetical protein